MLYAVKFPQYVTKMKKTETVITPEPIVVPSPKTEDIQLTEDQVLENMYAAESKNKERKGKQNETL
jgi:hypothetical protein